MRPMLLIFFSALAASACLAEPLNIAVSGANVQNLVSISWANSSSAFLPNYPYRSSFTVSWAIPNSALIGLDAKQVDVYVVATAQENSTVSFTGSPNNKRSEFTLTCILQDGACGPGSELNKKVEFTIVPSSSQPSTHELIIINASLSQQGSQLNPASILSSLSNSNYPNLANLSGISENNTIGKISDFGSQFAAGISPNSSPKEPASQTASPQSLSFLLQNPLVSLVAFALVIIVTGAYLLKNRD
ncbi:Uncharacterised protein [Candidatus Anstonella stagnisolia]|nr:Uncharacterised protein [Candidatus Anstonella stagnisolia]